MDDDHEFTDSIVCSTCNTPIMEVEPEGWWAGELEEMKRELHEAEMRTEEAEASLEDAHNRNVDLRSEMRQHKRNAEADADAKNNMLAMRLCDFTSVIKMMDDMIKSPTAPTYEELAKLNSLRAKGGLTTI